MDDPFFLAGEDLRARLAAGDETGGGIENGTSLRFIISLLGGDRPINVVCAATRDKLRMIYARLATSGTPTDGDIAKLKAAELCSN